MKSLIVTADDYAMSAAIDDGIVDLMRAGRLSGTACMSFSPRWPEAARRFTPDLQARCALGLHLDLTEFAAPPGPGRAQLFDRPFALRTVILHAYTRRLDQARLCATVAAQLDRFELALGRAPDYVDGHQHVHQLPQVRQALVAELERRYPPGQRPWLRVSDARRAQGFKGHVISTLGSAGLRQLARRHGVACTDRLLGVYDFEGGQAAFERHLIAWLPQAAQASALMCHPASRLDPQEALGAARLAEYTVLQGPAFANRLAQAGLHVADKTETQGLLPLA